MPQLSTTANTFTSRYWTMQPPKLLKRVLACSWLRDLTTSGHIGQSWVNVRKIGRNWPLDFNGRKTASKISRTFSHSQYSQKGKSRSQKHWLEDSKIKMTKSILTMETQVPDLLGVQHPSSLRQGVPQCLGWKLLWKRLFLNKILMQYMHKVCKKKWQTHL